MDQLKQVESPLIVPKNSSTTRNAEVWFRERFGETEAWLIAPGRHARHWLAFQKQGIVAIGFDDLGDIREYPSREAVHDAAIKSGFGKNPFNLSLALWEFANNIEIGHIIVAKSGRDVILGWGTVTGDYEHDVDRSEYRNIRNVDWRPCNAPIKLPRKPWPAKTLTRFSSDKTSVQYAFDSIEGKIENQDTQVRDYDIDAALQDMFVSREQFQRIMDSIELRKNLILQGPPGVGKTFIARRIAWYLIGRQSSDTIEMVQFHQSYAYEDFVQGWRPTESGGFALQSGVFLEFCKRAEKDEKTPYVFIIDEINRGNLSRIFGELLMLIEEDKRGADYAIPLTYDKRRFGVPVNVYILEPLAKF